MSIEPQDIGCALASYDFNLYTSGVKRFQKRFCSIDSVFSFVACQTDMSLIDFHVFLFNQLAKDTQIAK